MEVYVAVVMCLLGSSVQQRCVEIYPDQTVSGLAMCQIVGEQLVALWLPDHPGYEFSHVRCKIGAPFQHQQDI